MPRELYFDGPLTVNIDNVEGDVYIMGGASPGQITLPADFEQIPSLPPAQPVTPTRPVPPTRPARCAMDVRQCPDGSYVNRVGPNCEFRPCPPVTGNEQARIDASTNAFIVWSNRHNFENKLALASGMVDTMLTGAQMGAFIYQSALLDRLFDLDVARLADATSKARPLPKVPPPILPTTQVTVSFISDCLTPQSSAEIFRQKYGQEIQALAQKTRSNLEGDPDISFTVLSSDLGKLSQVIDRAMSEPSNPYNIKVSARPSGAMFFSGEAKAGQEAIAGIGSLVQSQIGVVAPQVCPPCPPCPSGTAPLVSPSMPFAPGTPIIGPDGNVIDYGDQERPGEGPGDQERPGEGFGDENPLGCYDGRSLGPESLAYLQGQIPLCDTGEFAPPRPGPGEKDGEEEVKPGNGEEGGPKPPTQGGGGGGGGGGGSGGGSRPGRPPSDKDDCYNNADMEVASQSGPAGLPMYLDGKLVYTNKKCGGLYTAYPDGEGGLYYRRVSW